LRHPHEFVPTNLSQVDDEEKHSSERLDNDGTIGNTSDFIIIFATQNLWLIFVCLIITIYWFP